MSQATHKDWGEASVVHDEIKAYLAERDVTSANEAQTRFDIIDRVIRDVWSWRYGQIDVEEYDSGKKQGYVDYILRQGDNTIVVEAKRVGVTFPSPTRRPKLKLSGSVLGEGEISAALVQAEEYAVSKIADVVLVTNGLCWCFYPLADKDEDSVATILFPFDKAGDAELLFDVFAVKRVEAGSVDSISNTVALVEDRLISVLKELDGRVDRNNVADYILPALNNALYADAMFTDSEHLKRCYVPTDARTKFNSVLGMYLQDPKPERIKPAPRIKRAKDHGHLEQIVENSVTSHAPPVTLIIGPVGVGKSTYLRHFEMVGGRQALQKKMAHWIYIDFEEMGKVGNPRRFIYDKLLDYLLDEHPNTPTTYETTIQPAYSKEIAALARGPFAPLFQTDKTAFQAKVAEHIERDFAAVEPYVDKIMRHIASSNLCVVVLDNVDLYEDEALETNVFAEGLALSKRILCNVIVSLRDTTFVKHQTDSTFNAYELRKLWLDPPPFKQVLSARLNYARAILKNKAAKIPLANGMQLNVPDLSVFFEIVQRSILYKDAGDFIDAVADLNIRRGLTLVSNFLTSGHVNGDRAIRIYLEGQESYRFPFHEVFKGTMLTQWRHFREARSDGVNLFDARLGSRRTRLLRMLIVKYLASRAQHEDTLETAVIECIRLFSKCGASEDQIVSCVDHLSKKGLLRSISAEGITSASTIALARSGGFYAHVLCKKHPYVEECMFDTAIDDPKVWHSLAEITAEIEAQQSTVERWKLRIERTQLFTDHLCQLESEAIDRIGNAGNLAIAQAIRVATMNEARTALVKSQRYHSG